MKTYFYPMRPPDFQFQQFSIWQDQCAMKVGTDAILLGACAPVPTPPLHIVDVGTGSGVVALMLAQRLPAATVTAIELDKKAVVQARVNVSRSPYAQAIQVVAGDWLQFSATSPVDWVVSNPPFHVEKTLASGARAQARYAGYLSPSQLLDKALEVLVPKGQITLIGPMGYIRNCSAWLLPHGYTLHHVVKVFPKPRHKANRWIASWRTTGLPLQTETLTIRGEQGQYTEAFRSATKSYYLWD